MKRALVFIPIVLGLVWNVGLRSPRLNTAHEEVTSGVTDDPLPATSARKPASTFKPLRPRITDEAPATSAASIATTINSRESLSTNEHIATSSSLVEITRTETNGGAPQTAPKELIHLCRSNMSEIVWGANAWAKAHLSDYLPNDLILLSNELSSPLAFLCPNDPEWASKATTNWNEFRAEWITYRVHRQAIEKPLQINVSSHYVVCPYHKHFQFGDHRFGWPAR